ncbi:MAG: VOC family protein [Actinomycetota bacterium]
MTSNVFARLDNIGLVVEHGFDVAAAYERLGFAVCSLGRQTARPDGHPAIPQATGSRCMNFARNGYLELVGVIEPDLPASGYDERLATHGPGPVKVTLGWNDSEAGIDELKRLGLQPIGPVRFDRTYPVSGRQLTTEMELTALDVSLGGLMAIATRHRRPSRTFPPATISHPNGAIGLDSVRIATPDPAGVMAGFGASPATRSLSFPTGGRVDVVDADDTAIESIGIAVTDIERVAELFDENAIEYHRDRDGLRATPSHDGAVPLVFTSPYG